MTRQELTELVDRIHATWNQPIPKTDQKTIYNAWWQLLQHLEAPDVHNTITRLAVTETFMPKPGHVLRSTVLSVEGWDAPSPGEAWVQLRRMAEAAHTGTYDGATQIHPLVKEVVNQLGNVSAYNLHTNGDRELFITTYQTNLTKHETNLTISYTTRQQPQPPQPETTNPKTQQSSH